VFIPSSPLHVVFILDTRCNLSCTHCSSAASRTGHVGYDTKAAKGVIDQLADAGVLDIALSGGEPLLRRDLEALVEHAAARGLRVGTSTNGFPLTRRRASTLRNAGLNRLQVSIDGPRDVHDAIRGRGSYERAIAAVSFSVDAGLRTHVCFTAMRSNVDHLQEVIDTIVACGAAGFNLSQFVPTGRGAREQDLTPPQARRALETWLAAKQMHPSMYFAAHATGLVDLAPGQANCSGGCQAGMSIACVTASGDVTPCVMFPLSLGSLHERSFQDIWQGGPVLDGLRSRHVGGVCGGCRHRIACGGCRAAAWAHTGDPLAGDHRCWLN
jgi:AdoMet-dependent heme synthase